MVVTRSARETFAVRTSTVSRRAERTTKASATNTTTTTAPMIKLREEFVGLSAICESRVYKTCDDGPWVQKLWHIRRYPCFPDCARGGWRGFQVPSRRNRDGDCGGDGRRGRRARRAAGPRSGRTRPS